MDKYEALIKLLNEGLEDAEKFFVKGNKAAGTRLRKRLQDVRKSSQELRGDIQEYKKSISK